MDEDLYGGFINPNDRRTLERLRGLSGDKLAGKQPAFDDPRLAELGKQNGKRRLQRALTGNAGTAPLAP